MLGVTLLLSSAYTVNFGSISHSKWFLSVQWTKSKLSFLCLEDESYLFEKAPDAWKSKKQSHPHCHGHRKPAKMWWLLMKGA